MHNLYNVMLPCLDSLLHSMKYESGIYNNWTATLIVTIVFRENAKRDCIHTIELLVCVCLSHLISHTHGWERVKEIHFFSSHWESHHIFIGIDFIFQVEWRWEMSYNIFKKKIFSFSDIIEVHRVGELRWHIFLSITG